jgi:hypothetical protein
VGYPGNDLTGQQSSDARQILPSSGHPSSTAAYSSSGSLRRYAGGLAPLSPIILPEASYVDKIHSPDTQSSKSYGHQRSQGHLLASSRPSPLSSKSNLNDSPDLLDSGSRRSVKQS